MVHSLAVLTGHPKCLIAGKPFDGRGSAPDPAGGPLPTFPSWWGWGWLPPPQELRPRSRPFYVIAAVRHPIGLQPWPFGPRSLLPQIHLPKSAVRLCSELNLFNPLPLYNPLYNIIL